MPFVVDASVVATWALPDETTQLTSQMLDKAALEGVLVPPIWWYEVRNMLLMAERRNRILPAQSDQFLRRLNDLDLQIADTGDGAATLRLARTHKLTAYDAAYLELAIRESLPLSTLDERLAQAASIEHVQVFMV